MPSTGDSADNVIAQFATIVAGGFSGGIKIATTVEVAPFILYFTFWLVRSMFLPEKKLLIKL